MIGIFDSGSGGLTVLRAIRDVLPSSDIVYFGDIKNVPYGAKTREELSLLTVHSIRLLQERGARSIVSACNSVSASLAISLFDSLSIAPERLIEMVGPTVAFFRNSDTKLLLCATPATINSGIYQSAFRMIGKSDVGFVAIPELASAIESGASATELESIIANAFKDIPRENIDALILACTHYPLAAESFRTVLGDKIHLFDPASAVAARVEKQFWPLEAGDGRLQFIISKESSQFRSFVERLFPGEKYSVEVVE